MRNFTSLGLCPLAEESPRRQGTARRAARGRGGELGQAVLPADFQGRRGYPGRAKRTERLPHQGFSTRKVNGVAVRRETSLFGLAYLAGLLRPNPQASGTPSIYVTTTVIWQMTARRPKGASRARPRWPASSPPSSPVWKSKMLRRVLNHRVVLHAIDATPARWRCRFLTARPSQHGRVIAEK